MNSDKTYKSYTIPNRTVSSVNDKNSVSSNDAKTETTNRDPFTEIEIKPLNVDKAYAREQVLGSIQDEKRALFYQMRNIARIDSSFYRDDSKIFYEQALFMKDFEDDYSEKKEFSSYFPYYQLMGYEQLRTYFTWRTQVRKGDVTDTSISYAFLYIYELLNNIGVASPQDGLDKLMAFWKNFRVYNTVIDRYLMQWIKDYHIYYPLVQSFYDFASEKGFRVYYPSIFAYESTREDSLDIFADISEYKIKKSIFFTEQNRILIFDCFYFLLTRFRESFKKKKKCFEDILYFFNETTWTPFRNALFHLEQGIPDRQVMITETEIYNLFQGTWTQKTIILLNSGRQLIGYIMKKMESELRQIVKFKHKISANINMCTSRTCRKFESMGLPLPETIVAWVAEFYELYNAKKISINVDHLMQIRKEALYIQERLIVSDEIDMQMDKPSQPEVSPSKPKAVDVWQELWGELTKTEVQALKIILRNQDIKAFALENNLMFEVLVDGINQKAMDLICDTILELDDDVTIYKEYRERLMEMVE